MEIIEKHSHAELLQEMRHGFSMRAQRTRSIDVIDASSLSTQKEVHHITVSRESKATVFCDVYIVLLVHFTLHGPTINAAAYQEALKNTLRGYTAQQTRMLTTVLLLLHDNGRPHSTDATTNFLKFCGWKNSSTSTTQTRFPLLDFHLLPKMKHHTRGQCFHSNGYVQNKVKKWLHVQDTRFSYEGLDKLTYSCKCLNRLSDYEKK
jgi:hypothetical protein